MSDVIPARFEVPTVREEAQPFEPSASSVEFDLHSCYYKDFFLLRTPITINGHPAEIKIFQGTPTLFTPLEHGNNSISVKLSIISRAVAPVLIKHGVYHVDTFYHEELVSYLISFHSTSSLKRFLASKEAVQKEVSSAIAKALEAKSAKKPHAHVPSIAVGVEVYLVSPTSTAGTSPEVRQVSLGNYSSIAQTWHESKLFDFSSAMFTDGMSTDSDDSGGCDKAELADLQKELKEVIAWFSLGVELKIPTHDLLAIREDFRTTDKCRLEMLIRWEQLEMPTWSKVVSALVNIGRKGLAENLAVKYGLPHPFEAVSASASEPVSSEVVQNEQKLFSKEKELQKAKQLQYDTSRRLEKNTEDEVPKLEAQVKSLTMEAKILRKQLKHRNEELEMYEEFKPSVKEEQLQILDRLVEEKNVQIKALRDELNMKENELNSSRKLLRKKEKELEQLMEELDIKSAQVFQLEEEVKKSRQSFQDQQEEMNRKLMEASAASVSHKNYLKELQVTFKEVHSILIQQECATMEINEKKEEIQRYNLELAAKDKKVSQLSEKISQQYKEMSRLREELQSRARGSELSAEQMNEEDERAYQLLMLGSSTMQLKLQMRRVEDQKRHQVFDSEIAQDVIVKSERVVNVVEENTALDPSDIRLTWRTAASSPQILTREIHAGTAVDGNVVYFTQSNTYEVFAYDSSNDWWSQLPDCPAMDCSIAIVNKMLTSIGGETSKGTTNQLFCLTGDGKNRKWVEIFPPMPTKRSLTKAVCTGTHLIVTRGSALTTTVVMNTTPLVWTTVADLPCPSLLYSLVECGEYLYAVHFDASIFKCSTSELIQSTRSNESQLWIEQEHFNISWFSTYFAIQGTFLSVGGTDSLHFTAGPTTAVRMYSPSPTSSWKVIGHMTIPRRDCFAAVLPNNRLLVVGGATSLESGESQRSVEIATIV